MLRLSIVIVTTSAMFSVISKVGLTVGCIESTSL